MGDKLKNLFSKWPKDFHGYLEAIKTFMMKGGWLFIVLFFVDLITKLSMNAYFGGVGANRVRPDIEVIPNVLRFTLIYNTGMSYGALANQGPAYRIALAVVSFIAGIAIFYLMWRYRKKLNLLKYYSLFLILAGDWGNFIDRAFYWDKNGIYGVIDWIGVGNESWPQFFTFVCNIADICISVGVVLLVLSFIIDGIKELNKDNQTRKSYASKNGTAKKKEQGEGVSKEELDSLKKGLQGKEEENGGNRNQKSKDQHGRTN